MKRLLLTAAALSLSLVACAPLGPALGLGSGPVTHKQAAPVAAGDRKCADLSIQALISPNAAVPGVFDCQGATVKSNLTNAFPGVPGDAIFQQLAKSPPVLTSARYVGQTGDGGFVYILDNTPDSQNKPVSVVYLLYLDKNGRVDSVNTAARQ